MIHLKNATQIAAMKDAGRITGEALLVARDMVRPGVSTYEIDQAIRRYIEKCGATPAFLGYGGFPASACISINDEVIHGIPSKKRILREGDIVSVDIGCIYKGYNSDAARTYGVGKISEEAQRLIDAARESFFEGLKFCKVGYRLSDVSHAIQKRVEEDGFVVIRDFVGHGIGRELHEDPQIPNYGKPGRGPRLAKGMVLAIEPMISEGTYEVEVLLDNWTAVTADGKLAAHYENTVVITDGEPELLTL